MSNLISRYASNADLRPILQTFVDGGSVNRRDALAQNIPQFDSAMLALEKQHGLKLTFTEGTARVQQDTPVIVRNFSLGLSSVEAAQTLLAWTEE